MTRRSLVHPHQLPVKEAIARDRRNERGAGAVEYALLLALIAIVVMGAVSFFGGATKGNFGKSQSCIQVAYGGAVPAGCS